MASMLKVHVFVSAKNSRLTSKLEAIFSFWLVHKILVIKGHNRRHWIQGTLCDFSCDVGVTFSKRPQIKMKPRKCLPLKTWVLRIKRLHLLLVSRSNWNRTFSKYSISYLVERPGGIKQNKSSRGSAMNNTFLFFYSPKSRSQVYEF